MLRLIHPTSRVGVDPTLRTALAQALQGGPVLAPLPPEPAATIAMLRPDDPVTEPDAALVVATSGSTGRPKGVVLTATGVRAGVEATHEALGGPGAWVLALPTHYVAGIMVLARGVVAGTEVLGVDPRLEGLCALPPTTDRRYISLVPTQLSRALDTPAQAEALAGLDAVLLGGSAAPAELLERARAADIRVVTSYGMSETGGGCVYDGTALPGVRLRLAPEDGRISIGGPVVFAGYRGRPELTAEVLRTAGDGERELLTADRGRLVAGRLQVLGRFDDVVVSGGVNVDLAHVEQQARRSDPEAVVVGVPDPHWGRRVVVASHRICDLRGLHGLLPDLEAAARPRGLLRVAELPMTSSGKVDRQRLIEMWPTHPDKEEL